MVLRRGDCWTRGEVDGVLKLTDERGIDDCITSYQRISFLVFVVLLSLLRIEFLSSNERTSKPVAADVYSKPGGA